MVRAGLGAPGDFTAALDPISENNAAAIRIWNRMGGDVRWPDCAYLIALEDPDDFAFMVERLYVIRNLLKEKNG